MTKKNIGGFTELASMAAKRVADNINNARMCDNNRNRGLRKRTTGDADLADNPDHVIIVGLPTDTSRVLLFLGIGIAVYRSNAVLIVTQCVPLHDLLNS